MSTEQPAPEASEREALAEMIAHHIGWQGGLYRAVDDILTARRSQPAPRTVTAEPIKVEWGVLLDDLGSTDTYENREQAEAARHYADGSNALLRIETYMITPGITVEPTP